MSDKATIKSSIPLKTREKLWEIYKTAVIVRQGILKARKKETGVNDINDALAGQCIKASDKLVDILKKQGYNCKAYQCWCLYEDFEGCTDIPYEEHWIVAINISGQNYYVDATIQQFQWAFVKDLPKVYIGCTLPSFLLPREPGRDTLSKCGWTGWYNTGDYCCNFDYYEYTRNSRNMELWGYIQTRLSEIKSRGKH